MRQPRLQPADLWRGHVANIHELLRNALRMLWRDLKQHTKVDEESLNLELYNRILRAMRDRELRDPLALPIAPPVFDARNPPSRGDGGRAERRLKRPDVQMNIFICDDEEKDIERSNRVFAIECKRLGIPPRADRIFNENYVLDGIARFVSITHLYGKDDPEGAMVGYIQSMEPHDVLQEVNAAALSASMPALTGPLKGWQLDGASEFEHSLTRTVGPSPFRLCHFWVDLRVPGETAIPDPAR